MALGGPSPTTEDPTAGASERQWLSDLRALLDHAQQRFADVVWRDEDSGRTVHAHKCIVYARATGSFQQRFLGVPHSLSESNLSLYGPSTTSFRTFTPSSAVRRDSLPSAHQTGRSPRPSSTSTCHTVEGDDAANGAQPLPLGQTDIGVFEAALEYFYTATRESEAFVVALDGFQDGDNDGENELKGVARLRQDLLYCWRSKLYADVSIVLDSVPGEPFAAHRAVLASRSPYFRSLLLGSYSDSNANIFTLPSPPFTPASITFVLGYMYTGTLDFSPRKFDLATSFEIWRCAAFLLLATLQSAIEAKILAQLNLARASRILAFAHAPDVGSKRLAAAAMPLVLAHFDTAWTATPHVGHLEYDVQKALVRAVCDAMRPPGVAAVARQVARARRQLEPERASWAEHVGGMLDGVEEALVGALAQNLPEVVASSGFVDLVDGVGFSTDVLEWLLTLVVKGLREAKAPEAYQALVGSVLLREEGIMADARVLIDDTRSGILAYIKRKWVNIRNAGGFDHLEPWCLKELADELELVPNALVADGPRPRISPAKARQPPPHLIEGVPSPVVRPLRSTGAPRPSHTTPPAVGAALRAPRPLNASTSSRAGSLASRAPSLPPQGAADAVATPRTRREVSSLTTTPRTRPAVPTTVVTQTTPRQSATRPVRPAGVVPVSSSPAVRPAVARPAANGRPSSIRSVASIASRVRSPSAAAEPVPRRSSSPAPSVASRRSIASTVSTRTPALSRPPAARRTSVSSTAAPANPRRPAGSPASPALTNGAAPRRQASAASLRSTTSTRTPAPAALRRPASSTSLASRRSTSTAQISGTTVRNPAGSPAVASASVGTGTARTAPRTRPPLAPVAGTSRRPALPAAATAAASTPGVPGTTLLAGIPCIVTVRPGGAGAGAAGKALQIRAQVRYIGALVGEEGQWVGVEALESGIPREAGALEWGDGSRGDVSYFQLTPAAPAADSGPPTRAAPPALRPPSRRAARRSSSPSGQRESGPRKSLFVRPHQIVYVL